MNPEKTIVGSIMPIIESNKATCCESVMFEINNPIDKLVAIKIILKKKNRRMLPCIGTFITKTASNKMKLRLTNDKTS